jgi:mannosyltransferase OCH1-like enzyme
MNTVFNFILFILFIIGLIYNQQIIDSLENIVQHFRVKSINSEKYIKQYHQIKNTKPMMKEWYTQKIPLKIHQTNESRYVDYNIYKASEINKRINLEYEYFFYDKQERKDFISKYFPQYMKHYESIIPGAYKVDLFRLLVLYQEGGVYLDDKMFCIVSLREILEPTDELYMMKDKVVGSTSIQNGFICSIQAHPVIKMCIDRYIYNIEKKYYGNNSLDIGGPMMIARIINIFIGRPELSKTESFEKNGVRISGRSKATGTGETAFVSDNDQVCIETHNLAMSKKKILETLNGNSYALKWTLGKVYK